MKDNFMTRYCDNCKFFGVASFKQHEEFQISLSLWRYKMSRSTIKKQSKQPQRNSPCKYNKKSPYITRGIVFLPGLNS